MATSGGAVFFAGGTVTIAPVSLAVAGIPLVTTMGLMAAVAVVVAVVAALTLLPAALGIVGGHVKPLRVRERHAEARAKAGLWAKWAADIAKYPLIAGLAGLAILLPLTIPLLSLNLGQQDVAALSTSTTARRAYDLISKSFGPGVNDPLLIAVSLGSPAKASSSGGSSTSSGSTSSGSSSSSSGSPSDSRATDPRLQTLQKDITSTSGVAGITPVQIDQPGTTAYFNAISKPTQATWTWPPGSPATPLQILVVIALSFVLLSRRSARW